MTQPMDDRSHTVQPEGEPQGDVEHEGEAEAGAAPLHAETAEHATSYDDETSEPLEEADAESVRPPPERIDE